MLDIMEAYVQEKGYSYVRMDGGTSISARQPLVQKYNTVSRHFCCDKHFLTLGYRKSPSVAHSLISAFVLAC